MNSLKLIPEIQISLIYVVEVTQIIFHWWDNFHPIPARSQVAWNIDKVSQTIISRNLCVCVCVCLCVCMREISERLY